MDRAELAERAGSAGLRPPRQLTFSITGVCNLRCQHCFVVAGTPAAPRHVPVEKARRVVSDFAALGGEGIRFTGGEPFTHPEFLAILEAALREPFQSVGVQTNAALVGEAEIAALRAASGRLAIEVSLEGASPATHDRVRGEGSFERTVAGIERLARAGLGGRVSIAFTEMRHNMGDVPALLELVDRLGLRSLSGGTLVARGRAEEAELEPPHPDQYRDLLSRYHADPRFRSLCDRYGRISAVEWWRGRCGERGEPCPFIEHPYLSPEGKVYPCLLLQEDACAVAGALDAPLGVSLAEGMPVWARLLDEARKRPAQLAECRDCPGVVHCAGGCMARALAASGELTAVEDRCALRRAVYGWDEAQACSMRGGCSVVGQR
jgi:radical SAM protein with 4Fe4S-binding SPASM domain